MKQTLNKSLAQKNTPLFVVAMEKPTVMFVPLRMLESKNGLMEHVLVDVSTKAKLILTVFAR